MRRPLTQCQAIIVEGERECIRYDTIAKQSGHSASFLESIQAPLETMEEDRRSVERAILEMNEIIEKVRAAEVAQTA